MASKCSACRGLDLTSNTSSANSFIAVAQPSVAPNRSAHASASGIIALELFPRIAAASSDTCIHAQRARTGSLPGEGAANAADARVRCSTELQQWAISCPRATSALTAQGSCPAMLLRGRLCLCAPGARGPPGTALGPRGARGGSTLWRGHGCLGLSLLSLFGGRAGSSVSLKLVGIAVGIVAALLVGRAGGRARRRCGLVLAAHIATSARLPTAPAEPKHASGCTQYTGINRSRRCNDDGAGVCPCFREGSAARMSTAHFNLTAFARGGLPAWGSLLQASWPAG